MKIAIDIPEDWVVDWIKKYGDIPQNRIEESRKWLSECIILPEKQGENITKREACDNDELKNAIKVFEAEYICRFGECPPEDCDECEYAKLIVPSMKVEGAMKTVLDFCKKYMEECDKEKKYMTNADLFKNTFGIYATELWSLPEKDFLKWLNEDVKPKTGHWEKTTDGYCYWYKCSCCGTKIPKNEWGSDYFSPYCPECGAKVIEPQERSE